MKATWILISCYGILLVAAGFLIPFIREKSIARTSAWAIILNTVAVTSLATLEEPPLIRMLIIVFLQLLSMKIIVAVENYSDEMKLNLLQWTAFSVGWFGMRPRLFERFPSPSLVYLELLMKGISRILIGIFFLHASSIVEQYPGTTLFFLPQLLMLAGVSFILHFGMLNLSAAWWRFMGVDASELFRSPYKSRSLKEFWGKRWNIAFSEMTALIAYRPLKTIVGTKNAVIISFFLSGLLHEIAISFPVNAGYGLPTLYFMIHATAMRLEASSAIVQNMLRRRIFSHVWVMVLLILPMPLLFHENFLLEVLTPLRNWLLSTLGLI